MDFTDLLKIGANMIQSSDNESTSGIDSSLITGALGSLFGSDSEEGGLDLSSIVGKLADGDLGETISSWIGSGENLPIDADKISELIGSDKISEFAEKLGVDTETASNELANVLPNIVDKATSEDSSLAESLLDKVGGVEGLMGIAGKLFKS